MAARTSEAKADRVRVEDLLNVISGDVVVIGYRHGLHLHQVLLHPAFFFNPIQSLSLSLFVSYVSFFLPLKIKLGKQSTLQVQELPPPSSFLVFPVHNFDTQNIEIRHC